MKRAGRILHLLLYPGTPVVLGGVLITALLMVYVFALGHTDRTFAYAAYLISAYCLMILILWLVSALKPLLLRLLHKNKWVHRYLADDAFRTIASLYRQIALNLAYVVLKFSMGIYYRSAWFIMLSAYYLLLILMRFLLLRSSRSGALGQNLEMEYRKSRICGGLLLLMNLILTVFVILVVKQNESYHYAGMLIYAMAAFTFYVVIMSIRNVIKYRKHNSPLVSASKSINFASTLISMLALETAMLSSFDSSTRQFRRVMVSVSGGVICVIFVATAVYMIAHSTKELRQIVETGNGDDI